MRIEDGTQAEVVDLTHDAGSVIATVEVTLPDGRTFSGFLSFALALTVTAGALKSPSIGTDPNVTLGADPGGRKG